MNKQNMVLKGCLAIVGAAVLTSMISLTSYAANSKDQNTSTNVVFTVESTIQERIEMGLVVANVEKEVNVREKPDKDSKKVGVLYKGCGGYFLAAKDGWTKIKSGDVVGWVSNDYVLRGEDARDIALENGILLATSKTANLRVRKEPNTDSKVLGHLDKDEAMEAVAIEGDWVEVSYEGSTGYVCAEYVSVEFSMDTAETLEQKREREKAEELARRMVQIEHIKANCAAEDILAALIQCEAGGEPYEGKVAVGAVVMNRVANPAYPDTITKVIYASKQFTPATSGKMTNLILKNNIRESCRQAARDAMNGVSPVGGALNFRRAGGNREGQLIGNQIFW